MNAHLFGRLFFSLWWVNLFHFRPFAAGSDRFALLVIALVERSSVRLDVEVNHPFYKSFTGDVIYYQGHAYSNFNPGLSFIASPAWFVVHLFYQRLPESSWIRGEAIHYLLVNFVSFFSTTAFLSALTSWMLATWTYRKTQQQWRGVLVGILYGLGSIAFFFSARFNQNIPLAAIATCVFILIFDPNFFSGLNSRRRFVTIGFLLGAGAIIDANAMPLLGAVFIILLWKNRKTPLDLAYVALGAIFPLSLQLLYQYVAFGSPFLSSLTIFARQTPPVETMNSSAGIWQKFHLMTLGEYLFSAKAGLFIYMPYAGLSLWYFLVNWHNDKYLSIWEKRGIFILFCCYFAFICLLPPQYLYPLFGPRYLLPIIPFICLIFVLYFRKQDVQLGMILLAIAFLINIGGTQLGNDTGNVFLTVAVYALKGPWLPILDWLQKELPKASGYSPEFVSPYGLFAIMLLGLVVLWLPCKLKRRY
ncbi:hypothetical protein [Oscillatoria sp. FACHB-1406]|uniref:hypothetical protein n=1 Tax=Oscillatoria sp. FACHB-1406 TaxID=2692846 RepID=UPI00168599E1|nr:hypothetical protein [Oscillatoria sp. FACHB-1406]MBD2579765.1 hypothetical protein [Oscillatoria sp. FACHB-1406]